MNKDITRKIESVLAPPELELNGMPYREYIKPHNERSYPYNKLDGGYPINRDDVNLIQKIKCIFGFHDWVGYLDADNKQFVRTRCIVCGKKAGVANHVLRRRNDKNDK